MNWDWHQSGKSQRKTPLQRFHSVIIDLAEGVQALRADDLPRAVRPGGRVVVSE
jgi:hypothetical protein